MSEKILKALMELFSIISLPTENKSNGKDCRPVVAGFLKRQLNQELVPEYLEVFDVFYKRHQDLLSKRGDKRIAAVSVKILRICQEVNKELTQKQKYIILVHLLEFAKSDSIEISDLEFELIFAVADGFNIPKSEYLDIKDHILLPENEFPQSEQVLIINNEQELTNSSCKHIFAKHLKGHIRILHIPSDNLFFLRYMGDHELYLNGQLLTQEKVHVFNTGSSIRNHTITPIYYSDVVSLFHHSDDSTRIIFEAKAIEYKFKSGTVGLHPMSFREDSGQLVGIMGASGAGKSTLLNVLNGTAKPGKGTILVNGINIHTEKDKVEGLIGHVSQDDLLIEELTVYQNLYYNAKLCFSDYSREELGKTVDRMLTSLGLYEIKDVQVGSPLNKKISGGQRKRLNIALELIREPSILFLDEPTSGLSSRDSENIMDLLKELALKGKLVFVVIHQPSSDIFKMFDKLLILDTGGYLIYEGDPIESILYFKSKIHHANYNESECRLCGNVNPEQIFNIVESSVLDEYGKITQKRKVPPREWYSYYGEEQGKQKNNAQHTRELPKINFHIPNLLIQFLVFIKRDILAKIANKQYMVINFLEAPLLAFILSFIIKYYDVSETNELGYTYMGNSNIPVYIFMSVIVAIFMGLTVSAEEIIKDRKILKREAFLNLSWGSYLLSKIAVLTLLSAIQAISFVIIGNSVLEIKGMYLHYWILLFSCWVSANLLGLVISDSFKTVVTIYILIPFLVIPQIILSGIIVRYEKLNPHISSPDKIPFYGEIITARWGYEALAVHQFKNNVYMREFYNINRIMSVAEFKKYYWVKNLENKIDYIEKHLETGKNQEKIANYLTLVRNEIDKEVSENQIIKFSLTDQLAPESINADVLNKTRDYLKKINKMYNRVYNRANDQKDALIRKKQNDEGSKEDFIELKRRYHNDKLAEFVENTNETVRIIEYKGRLLQKIDPIYLLPEHNLVKAHFYAPQKKVFGALIDTFWVNTMVIWFMSVLFYIMLQLRLLKKFLELADNLSLRFREKRSE